MVRSGRVGASGPELFTRGALAKTLEWSEAEVFQEWEKRRAMRKMGFSVQNIAHVPSVGVSGVVGRGFRKSGDWRNWNG